MVFSWASSHREHGTARKFCLCRQGAVSRPRVKAPIREDFPGLRVQVPLGHIKTPIRLLNGHAGSSPARAAGSARRSAFRAFLSFLVRALQPELACLYGDGLGSLGDARLQCIGGRVPGEGDLVLAQVPDHPGWAYRAHYVGSGSGPAPGPRGGGGEKQMQGGQVRKQLLQIGDAETSMPAVPATASACLSARPAAGHGRLRNAARFCAPVR